MGRGGPRSLRAQQTVRDLEEHGVDVMVCTADVGDERQVVTCLSEIEKRMPPLRGIVHAAAVIDDAVLVNLDATRLLRVMAPKARGAWLLHTAHSAPGPRFLRPVLLGIVAHRQPGQGSYVAANAYLDALAHHRRAMGLAATSVNWGAIGEVGMAAENKDVAAHLARVGIKPIAPRDAVAALAVALENDATQIGIIDVDWQKWRRLHPSAAASPKFAYVLDQSTPEDSAAVKRCRSLLLAAAPHERPEIAALVLADLIAETTRMSPENIDLQRPLTDMGIDSLMGLDCNSRSKRDSGCRARFSELQKGDGVIGLARRLCRDRDRQPMKA